MYVSGHLAGYPIVRRFATGVTTVAGQIVTAEGIISQLASPSSVNAYVQAIGVADSVVTYAAAAPPTWLKIDCSPFQLIRGEASGGTAADTAWTAAELLTESTGGSAVLISDVAVATLDYHNGYVVALSGTAANIGHVRTINVQVDTTSMSVVEQFPAVNTAADTYFRTYGFGNQGVELTTNFVQFNNLIAAGEDIHAGTPAGNHSVWEVYFDGQAMSQGSVSVASATAFVVEFEVSFRDHVFNKLA